MFSTATSLFIALLAALLPGQVLAPEIPPRVPGSEVAHTQYAEVIFVYDGDTVRVRIGSTTERVRYIGIDAPERSFEEGTEGECFAEEAYLANRSLTLGEEVELHTDVRDRDVHDRLLRHVVLPEHEMSVGELLVREGYAVASSVPPDTTYAEALAAAEQSAREGGVGLWGVCDS